MSGEGNRVVLTLAFDSSEQEKAFHSLVMHQVPDAYGCASFLALPYDQPISFSVQIGDTCRMITIGEVVQGARPCQEVLA